MNLLVDTSVWSLALRRDAPSDAPEVTYLAHTLETGGSVITTGLVLQELLQGFRGARSRDRIVRRFASLPFLMPDRSDHIAAADLRTACRRKGIKVGTIDALLAQLCITHDLVMLTTDADFSRAATVNAFTVWNAAV